MRLLSCKMILLCHLSLCQVEQFQVQLLLNADDRNLSYLPRLILHVIICCASFLRLIRMILIHTDVT